MEFVLLERYDGCSIAALYILDFILSTCEGMLFSIPIFQLLVPYDNNSKFLKSLSYLASDH